MHTSTVADARRHYAEEVRLAGNILSDELIEAFAKVPREDFLGPGPWDIPLGPRYADGEWGYRATADDDPRRLYHNVLVAIDPGRQLHNGLPSFLAFKIEAARIAITDRVVHVGAGVGYYTAIMAELARDGRVVAIETDPDLAERSRSNLRPWSNVEVVHGDGTTYDPGDTDVFFINAGATHPAPVWLDRLVPNGRMVLPITFRKGDATRGIVLLIENSGWLSARTITGISVFDCVGGRDDEANAAIGEALKRSDWAMIRSLRAIDHEPDGTCWAHLGATCVSKRELDRKSSSY